MKKLLLAAAFYFLSSSELFAAVPCTPLPVTLTNGTIADANQVMSNFNFIATTCLGGAAAAGANSDITSLSALSTPISPSQGGTSAFTATAPSTGSANAQIVAATTPLLSSLGTLNKVIFVAGFTNGTGNTTLTVGGTGAKNVFRRTTDGPQALAGGEIVVNTVIEVVYDGAQWELMSNISPFPVGTVLTTISTVGDTGFLLMQGQCVSQTTFAALYAKMGSPGVGSCTAGNFNIPDGRGRVVAMIDSGGSGRITAAGGNFDGTVMFGSGGLQNKTLLSSDLPNTIPTWTFSAGTATWTYTAASGQVAGLPNAVISNGASPGAFTASPFNGASTQTGTVTGITGTVAVTGVTGTNTSINGGVTQTLFPTLQPTLMLNKQVKY